MYVISVGRIKMNTLIVGLQYGDEGKGRVSAHFGKDYDWYVRFNGGPNAGHTVYHEGRKYALHHFPSGAVLGKKVALDAGMVIDVDKMFKEWSDIVKCMKGKQPKIYMSNDAHIIQPEHIKRDGGGSGIGSTKRGIAYAYSDKALRQGMKAGKEFAKQYSPLKAMGVKMYSGLPPCIGDGESALYEGAQGVMLDINYGCYPYVTSSSVFPSTIHNIDRRIGVMKAYTSRVGDGPPDYPEVDGLAEVGDEFGTTTGRRRRCTWLVMEELEYAISLLQPDEIVLTKVDILDKLDTIGVWMRHGELIEFKTRRDFENFIKTVFPKVTWVSDSPDRELRRVK